MKAWIPRAALDVVKKNIAHNSPYESGGLLMGYWSQGEAVVTLLTLPGPRATHRRYSFVPDYEHDRKIAMDLYIRSEKKTTYLGDWHNHPTTNTAPSWKDRKTLKKIARDPKNNCLQPLMLIFNNDGSNKECYTSNPSMDSRSNFGFLLSLRASISKLELVEY